MHRAVRALVWCAAFAACAALTAPATGADKPGPVPRAQLERWIAGDEAALRGPARRSPAAYGAHVASLLNELWLAHRDGELAQRLATIGARLPGASDDRADARFFRGDDSAAFDAAASRSGALRDARTLARTAGWIAVVERLRGVREGAHPDGRSIDAALVEGDLYAACGRLRDARITWYRAFSTAVLARGDHYRFYPAWTSAMRRLLRFRSAPDRRIAHVGCSLPPPIVDPIG